MEKSNNNSTGGLIVGLLGIAFIVLKLCNVINWSWWIVTLPFWGGFALLMILLLIAIAMTIRKDRRKEKKRNLDRLKTNQTDYIPKKSKFQERLEEMERIRKSNRKN